MTTKTLDNYFDKQLTSSATPVNEQSSKRPRSEGSEGGSMSSNSPKRIIYDTENEAISLPDDAPPWVSVLLKAIDNVNDNVSTVTTRLEDLSLKFDNYKAETDSQLTAVRSSVEDLKVDYDKKNHRPRQQRRVYLSKI